MARRRLISHRALAIEYEHVDSARRRAYRHDFGEGVEIYELVDGSVLLKRADGRPLMETRLVRDDE